MALVLVVGMMDQRKGELLRWSARARRTDERGVVKDQHWPGTLMALGVIAFLVTLWLSLSVVYLSVVGLLQWFALFAFAGNLLPYVRSGLSLGMERFEWFLFNLLAIGPFLWCAMLVLNLTVHGPERVFVLPARGMDPVRYWRDHDARPTMREISMEEAMGGAYGYGGINGTHALTGVAEGCLGWEVRTWPGKEE